MNYILIRTVGQLFVWMILLASCLPGSVKGETATSLFQQALTEEKGQGDRQAALRLYQQVVDRYGRSDVEIAKQARERMVALGGKHIERTRMPSVGTQERPISVPEYRSVNNSSFGSWTTPIAKRNQDIARQRLRTEQGNSIVGLYSRHMLNRLAGADRPVKKAYERNSYHFWAATFQQALGFNRMIERVMLFQSKRRKTRSLSSSDFYIAGLIAEKEQTDQVVVIDLYRKALDNAPEILAAHIQSKLDVLSKK